jgi:regulator of protease activity HflC (stomatin/prohibitin superfamily)
MTTIMRNDDPVNEFAKHAKSIAIFGVAGLVVLILLFGAFFTIPAGYCGVLTTFGAASQTVLAPGLHFKIPIMQDIVKMNVQVQKNEQVEDAASLDLQVVKTTVATNWNIDDSDASWIYQKIGMEPALNERIFQPVVSNAVKAVVAHYNAEELVTKRDQVRTQIDDLIRTNLKPYHVNVDVSGVSITDFQFSTDYASAIEQKQVAQQRAQQAEYELQQAKVEAERQIAQAQGQSEAQKLLQQTLTPQLIQQEAIAKWDGHLPNVVGGNGVIPMIGNVAEGSH